MKTNILMIYAYPNHKSLNNEIFQRVKKGFEEREVKVEVLDLYEENFDPVLIFNEELRRRDLQYRGDMKKYRDQITWADHVVFLYPIWWGGMPAILKGYFDKVFTTGFSYNFKGLLPEGKLKGKTATIITTDDTPPLFRILALKDYGNVLKNQILRIMTGVKVKKHIRFSYVKGRSEKKLEKWLNSCYLYAKSVHI